MNKTTDFLKSQKLNNTGFIKKYSRVKRENLQLSDEYITEAMKPYMPNLTDNMIYAVAIEVPINGYYLITELDLQNTLPLFNSLILYRVFKKSYESPDIVGAFSPKGITTLNGSAFWIEWSYTIKVSNSVIAEFTSKNLNNRFKLKFWLNRVIPENAEERKSFGKDMANFMSSFTDFYAKNTHLFNEKKELDNTGSKDSSLANIFAERYKSAQQMNKLANSIDILPERKDLEFNEKTSVSDGGSVYMSSAILYVVSMEALINTLFTLLLKEEFISKNREYDRITIQTPIDVRLMTAHLFCSGFSKQILSPNTDLWKKLKKLTRFRNSIVHGNLTPEHHVHALREDGNYFFYNAVTDYRGRLAERNSEKDFPTTMSHIDNTIVSEIKEIVDEIVTAIKEACDSEHKQWLENWLDGSVIKRFTSAAEIKA